MKFDIDWEIGTYKVQKTTNNVGITNVTLLLYLPERKFYTLTVKAVIVTKIGLEIGKPAVLEIMIDSN